MYLISRSRYYTYNYNSVNNLVCLLNNLKAQNVCALCGISKVSLYLIIYQYILGNPFTEHHSLFQKL